MRLDLLRVSYARSLNLQRQMESSGRVRRLQSWRDAGGGGLGIFMGEQ